MTPLHDSKGCCYLCLGSTIPCRDHKPTDLLLIFSLPAMWTLPDCPLIQVAGLSTCWLSILFMHGLMRCVCVGAWTSQNRQCLEMRSSTKPVREVTQLFECALKINRITKYLTFAWAHRVICKKTYAWTRLYTNRYAHCFCYFLTWTCLECKKKISLNFHFKKM